MGARKKMPHPSVNPKTAALGRLDYVQVEQWGNLDNDVDLGNLKVKQYATTSPADDNRPFYEQLVLHLQWLETNGSLKVVQPQGAPPLPPFEKWSFTRDHYLQYLADQYTLHEALERAFSEEITCALGDLSEDATQEEGATAALCKLGALSLDRAQALAADILALSKSEATSTGQEATSIVESLEPTTYAASYSEYVTSIAKRCSDSENSEEERVSALCALLANFFVIHITHLTTIMRIGAKATESLDLFQLQAVNYYHTYPKEVENPMKVFMAGINDAGIALGSIETRDDVKEELGKAMKKCSQLLNTLAVDTSTK